MEFFFDLLDNQASWDTLTRSIPWLLWNIWKNRNSILYADTQESLAFWIQNAEEEATSWFEANRKVGTPLEMCAAIDSGKKWSPPIEGTIKMQCKC